eukprot:2468800-Prymnesium_polylepis.1
MERLAARDSQHITRSRDGRARQGRRACLQWNTIFLYIKSFISSPPRATPLRGMPWIRRVVAQ